MEIEVKGKSVEDAVELAEKQLGTTKDNISYEVIEETNKTLFSILAPKYAIIKAKAIDDSKCKEVKEETHANIEKKPVEALTEEEKVKAKEAIDEFLTDFFKAMNIDFNYTMNFNENIVELNINGDNSGILIGYRGEILDSLQVILGLILNNKLMRSVKIQIDTENYREKRKAVLINLAHKMAGNVVRTGRNITLEPMAAYERKIIHTALQDNSKIETVSVGEEPYRKVMIKIKK